MLNLRRLFWRVKIQQLAAWEVINELVGPNPVSRFRLRLIYDL